MAESFMDKMYDEITKIIGGNNPNQFFCMTLPGMLLDADQYKYDTEKSGIKPAHVKANESKLVDKLFDACQMTGADNGRHLSTQYKTVLDVLTPRLNSRLFDAKNKLRKVLMTPYPYNFNDGKNEIFTIGQVFYRLFAEYVAEREEWARERIEKQEELKLKYPSDEDQTTIQDEYLEWYGVVGEARMLGLEEKLDTVLNVFSPGDMRIITGILDSGAGRELAEARAAVDNSRTISPDGGYVYPVTLYPDDWFNLLDTDFKGTDLLETPEALTQKLSNLTATKSGIYTNLTLLMAQISDKEEVDNLKKAYKASEIAFQEATASLATKYTGATLGMVKTVAGIMLNKTGEISTNAADIPKTAMSKIFLGITPDQIGAVADQLTESMQKCSAAQVDVLAKAQAATDAAKEYAKEKNSLQLQQSVPLLEEQLKNVDNEIEDVRDRLNAVMAADKFKIELNNDSVEPGCIPDNFMKIVINSTLAEAFSKSNKKESASSSSAGASFFFGGYSSNKSHSDAVSASSSNSSSISIEVGMAIAKVVIGREWFNPGVFLLSQDMYNTSSKKISPSTDYGANVDPVLNFSNDRLDEMNKCLFPCFPTAFVVARDVAIKFSTADSSQSNFASSVEDHASKGGGFFCFSGSSSSSSSSSNSSSSSSSSGNSVIVRFKNPQILGYYLQATAPDKSNTMASDKSDQIDGDFISIFKFIENFQVMLNDHNKEFNKDTLKITGGGL